MTSIYTESRELAAMNYKDNRTRRMWPARFYSRFQGD